MGFNFYSYGNLHPCGVSNGKVYYMLPSGKRIEFDTKLDIEIPKQTNLFISDKVAFLLYHEDKMYIGRYDSSISIYRTSDELLIGLNTWTPSKYAETIHCGFYTYSGAIYEIHLDLKDRQTLYVCRLGIEGCLKSPVEPSFDLDASALSASAWGNSNNYHIYNKRGEPIEVDVWTVQDDVRKRNCRIFL